VLTEVPLRVMVTLENAEPPAVTCPETDWDGLLPHPTRGVMIERLNSRPKISPVRFAFAFFFMATIS